MDMRLEVGYGNSCDEVIKNLDSGTAGRGNGGALTETGRFMAI